MNHTPQIKKAIEYATEKHQGQVRRGKEQLPYITHPIAVAELVQENGGNEAAVIAALLHDTLEDTDATPEEIAGAFGPQVLELVRAVTEPNATEVPWRARKEVYLAQLGDAPDEALLISLGDKVHNTESKLGIYEKEGEEFLKQFHSSRTDHVWYYDSIIALARERLPNNPLTERLIEARAREDILSKT